MKQPENIIKLKKGETKEARGEKLILNGMARDYLSKTKYSERINLKREKMI